MWRDEGDVGRGRVMCRREGDVWMEGDVWRGRVMCGG